MNKAKKALDVLSGDCENQIIKSDMIAVLRKEFIGLTNSFDASCNHNDKLINNVEEFKSLLSECLNCLNEMPNHYIKERFMTYDLAAKIETLLRG